MEKKVDSLGRIVIPIELRKKYDLNEGAEVLFKEEKGFIFISSRKRFCRLCDGELQNDRPISLCNNCIEIVKKLC